MDVLGWIVVILLLGSTLYSTLFHIRGYLVLSRQYKHDIRLLRLNPLFEIHQQFYRRIMLMQVIKLAIAGGVVYLLHNYTATLIFMVVLLLFLIMTIIRDLYLYRIYRVIKFEHKFEGHLITKIENYYLNQPIEEAPDLTELDSDEYVIFEASMFKAIGIKKLLKDEKIYHGHDISFNGANWNTTIGVTEGKIYQIGIQYISQDKNEVSLLFQKTLDYLVKEMGKYSEHSFLSKKYIWDASEGSVKLHQVNKFGLNGINLLLTSSSIRGTL